MGRFSLNDYIHTGMGMMAQLVWVPCTLVVAIIWVISASIPPGDWVTVRLSSQLTLSADCGGV